MIQKMVCAIGMLVFFSPAAGRAQIATAIVGARVIDGTGAPPRQETVVLQGSRILAVAPDAAIPPGASILNATGKTLVPGLFDLHTHLNASATDAVDDIGKSLKAYLVCGVTSVNDYSVYGEMLAPLRSLENSGVLVGPRVKFAIRFGTRRATGRSSVGEITSPNLLALRHRHMPQ